MLPPSIDHRVPGSENLQAPSWDTATAATETLLSIPVLCAETHLSVGCLGFLLIVIVSETGQSGSSCDH